MESRILPDRTFEAIVFDWDGTAVPDRRADASEVRARVEALCEAGVEVVVVSGTHVGNVDAQLGARPCGPGRLYLCLNRGSEVFGVDGEGPRLVLRRTASPGEDAALDRAAALTVERLRAAGLPAAIVSHRLNRRKIDLIPEPAWADPSKAAIGELLAAVTERLHARGFGGLSDVVRLASEAAREAGLVGARVTSDVKHVEIGLTDKSDAARWALGTLRDAGIGPGLVLILGDEFGPLGGVPGSDALMLLPEGARATAVSVGVEPGGVPPGVASLGGGPRAFLAILDEQIARRRAGRVPAVDEDPAWTIVIEGDEPHARRVRESLLSIADGRFGTRGAREERDAGSHPLVVAAGVFDHVDQASSSLLPGPLWTRLSRFGPAGATERSVLDLRTGVLLRERDGGDGTVRSLRFASLARPGTAGLRAEGPHGSLIPGDALRSPVEEVRFVAGGANGLLWAKTESAGVGVTAAAATREQEAGELRTMERLVAFVADSRRVPRAARALAEVRTLGNVGFERLLAEHRAAWASRWRDAEVSIEGDDDAQLASRFALFHLIASVAGEGEAAVGARGLTGPAYGGRVFWDADVFVLPALAATHPAAARAMLEYRLRRLEAARREAAARGYAGALFPWESARDGDEVAPRFVRGPGGRVVPIRTGEHAEHVVAGVAWAAWHYAAWTGDEEFLRGPGRALLTETARYWSSRVRYDRDGRAHLYGVTGPDEYHEVVDDNAYTNVMARWNLRRAADLVETDGIGGGEQEVALWRRVAGALADGYDPDSRVYEQFAGFRGLDPLTMPGVATPPVAADVLLGRERVAATQIVKQADVLMLHHLIPEETAPGSLVPNLDYYDPRTAHGSSLSPAIHAALLARAGRTARALDLFRIASRLDLDDLTGTTAAGLHLATFGGVWQALAFGFAGVRPHGDALLLDPRLPDGWDGLALRLRFRSARVGVHIRRDRIDVDCDGTVRLLLPGSRRVTVRRPGMCIIRTENGWEETPS